MTGALAGDQWNEGDVSCSVVRRVALPDAFFAIDGSLETLLTVLQQMEAFPSAIAQENERNLPFLATTTILMEAVKRGAGRETAHEAIKEHSLAAVKAMRTGAAGGADLLDRLAGDRRIGLGKKALQAHPGGKRAFRRGRPPTRSTFSSPRCKPIAKRVKGAAEYRSDAASCRPISGRPEAFQLRLPAAMRFPGPSLSSTNPLYPFTWLNS